MKNKIYYGEYTLCHWIEMMLNGDIELPEYQRHFAWSEEDVERLIQSLKEGQFVPPVTIARHLEGKNAKNLILDGQQRLTSLLLAYLGWFPNPKKNDDSEIFASEDDSESDEKKTLYKEISWQYPKLFEYGKNKDEILSKLQEENNSQYKKLANRISKILNDEFLKNNYLGFNYIVPNCNDEKEIRKNFSMSFRYINYYGKNLNPMESRMALCFQNPEYAYYFEGKCVDGTDVLSMLRVMSALKPVRIDFVRYLAILSQYVASQNDAKKVMEGYSAYSKRESYYADYVSYVIGLRQEYLDKKFLEFDFLKNFPNGCWKKRFETVKDVIEKLTPVMHLNEQGAFLTLYEADVWLFGLLYYVLFEGKKLNGYLSEIKYEIERFIEKQEKDPVFKKNPNRIKYVRNRLEGSCEIYSHYVQ